MSTYNPHYEKLLKRLEELDKERELIGDEMFKMELDGTYDEPEKEDKK
jgi:hypothetical protein